MADAQHTAGQSRADEFLDLYKQLEEAGKVALKIGPHDRDSVVVRLGQRGPLKSQRTVLEVCRETRNLLQHNPKVDGAYAIEPAAELVDALRGFIARLEQRPTCMSIAVPVQKVFSCRMDDHVGKATAAIARHGYSCVPIMEGGKVAGACTASSYLHALAWTADTGAGADRSKGGDKDADTGKGSALAGNPTFGEIRSAVSLDRAGSEIFIFVARTAYVDELEDEFEDAFRRGKRIAAAFVTEHGKASEGLLGMLTAWDVLGH